MFPRLKAVGIILVEARDKQHKVPNSFFQARHLIPKLRKVGCWQKLLFSSQYPPSKAASCNGEGGWEQLLVEAGAPPGSFGLEELQPQACLSSPKVCSRTLLCKLEVTSKSPQEGDWVFMLSAAVLDLCCLEHEPLQVTPHSNFVADTFRRGNVSTFPCCNGS